MRRATSTVFDEFVSNPTLASPVYTSDVHVNTLGANDMLNIQATIDNISTSGIGGQFDLFIEHSCDGRNWLPANPANFVGTYPSAGKGDLNIPAASLTSTSPTAVGYGANAVLLLPAPPMSTVPIPNPTPFPYPLLSLIRFRMGFTATSTSAGSVNAHVRIHVCQRDWS